ncbi:MAG: hypothetical protein A2Z45_05185 [Chloroflexi bacterium RBG_19FT_COMBO_55_16]|nr:MAG: hypothetical protein A2Z45_05185 [Chloroflexi bacterium RBG_19FT_COMBO_55_16]
MDIIVSQEQSRVPVTVFRIEGRINLGNADELTKMVEEAYKYGMRNLLIDMTQLDSLTSAGLRSILSILKLLGTGSGAPESEAKPIGKSPHLKLLNPSTYVLMVLKTAGFDRYIETFDNLQEALASF